MWRFVDTVQLKHNGTPVQIVNSETFRHQHIKWNEYSLVQYWIFARPLLRRPKRLNDIVATQTRLHFEFFFLFWKQKSFTVQANALSGGCELRPPLYDTIFLNGFSLWSAVSLNLSRLDRVVTCHCCLWCCVALVKRLWNSHLSVNCTTTNEINHKQFSPLNTRFLRSMQFCVFVIPTKFEPSFLRNPSNSKIPKAFSVPTNAKQNKRNRFHWFKDHFACHTQAKNLDVPTKCSDGQKQKHSTQDFSNSARKFWHKTCSFNLWVCRRGTLLWHLSILASSD